MKKFLLSVACLCLLAVLVPAAKLNAAETLPWDKDTEVKGTVQIGSTMTVDAAKTVDEPEYGMDEQGNWVEVGTYPRTVYGEAYFKLDAVAGQSYYIAGAEKDNVYVYVYKHNPNGYYEDEDEPNNNLGCGENIGYRNLYATANETWYIYLVNTEDKAATLTLLAGQTFTGTVTKNDGFGDNYYFFTPVLSGDYTFEITSSDPDADPDISIGYLKRGKPGYLSVKNGTYTSSFGKNSEKVTLQAGQQYVIEVSGYRYQPYTLTLIQSPTVPVDKVVAKKAVSKKAKKAVVTWKKVAGANGYEVTYSLKKNYKNAKTVKVAASKAKVTLKKLKRGKTYYVKVRAYKTVDGNTYFGAYSKNMKVKVK